MTAAPADPLDPQLRAWLDREGPLVIGWPQFPPMASRLEDGDVAGYGVDTWDLAALKLGIDVEHVVVGSVDDVVAAFRTGEVDVVGGAGERPDLVEGTVRTQPYAFAPTGPVALPELVPSLPADLAGATVTTVPGSPLVERVRQRFPAATYVEVESIIAAFEAVENGEIDALYGPYALLGSLIQDRGSSVVPFGAADVDVEISGVGLQGAPATAVLQTMRENLVDAELSLIHVKWTGIDLSAPDTSGGPPSWLAPAVASLFGVAVLLGLLALVLRRRIRSATSELQALNAQLEQVVDARTAALHDSNRALQQFATTAAHDLKGPLSAICGLGSLLRQVELDESQRDDVHERITSSAQRLGSMVDAMLEDAIRIGASGDVVDGPTFARWLREVTAPELSVIDGRMDVDVPDGDLDLDVATLRRTALNLVGNATKYATNEGGTIVRVTLHRVGSAWELEVADNGPGIPQPLWSGIFERGSRLVHDHRGFGLGLSAIRDLVQGVGGAIRVSDAALGGACFTVTLPRREPAPVALRSGGGATATALDAD